MHTSASNALAPNPAARPRSVDSPAPVLLALVSLLIFWSERSYGIEFPLVVDVDKVACEAVALANPCTLTVAGSKIVAQTTSLGCGYFKNGEGPLNNRWFAQCDPVFTSGYARVCILSQDNNLGCGLIDSSANVVIPLVYDDLRLVKSESVVAVNYQNKWGYYSLTEKRLLFAPQFSSVSDFGDGLAYVIDADDQLASPAWIINDRGLRVASVDQQTKVAGHFANGLIPAEIDFRWGYLDSNGNWAIAPQFFTAEPFINGMASVKYVSEPEQWAIIDTRGAGLVFFEGPAHQLTLTEPAKLELRVACQPGEQSPVASGRGSLEIRADTKAENKPCLRICFEPAEKVLDAVCLSQ